MITIWGYLKNGNGVEIAHFLDAVDDATIIEAAKAIARNFDFSFDNVVASVDYGDIIWSAYGFDEADEPADIDSDMGFDPYMGCFSDDC